MERKNAIKWAKQFLIKLCSPYNGGYKKIPSDVRREARHILKHYINDYELEQISKCKKCSKLIGDVE